MYTVSIKASELAKITTENYHKGKEHIVEEISKLIKEASGQGKREVDYSLNSSDYFCCVNTDLAIKEFEKNGYTCYKRECWDNNLYIHVEW